MTAFSFAHRAPLSQSRAATDREGWFDDLVKPYLTDAFTLACWITGSRAGAADVVRAACLNAFRGVAGFPGGNPRLCLLRIVRHAARDWLPANRPAAFVIVEEFAGCARPRDPIAAIPVAETEAPRIEASIAMLPPTFRETLVLREILGLTHREIAEVTEVPVDTATSRLGQARRWLIAPMAARTISLVE
jgi:RNA polymerase sigma factor (sigma-70 family)